MALAFVFFFQMAFLTASAAVIRNAYSWYRQMKPVIALTVMSGGFLIRFADIWAQRFSESHDIEIAFDLWVSICIHIVGTAAAIIGVLCWLRVTMPHWCGRKTWLLAVLLALAVFIYPAFV